MTAFDNVTHLTKMLDNLDQWIDLAIAHAEKKKFSPEVYVAARLAPDQYDFARQIQSACDAAKFAGAYLAGQTAPSHPDTEKTLPELRARIKTCTTYMKTLMASDFAGAEERRVSPKWMGGKWVTGSDYLNQIAVPNFYFHATTAYSILRHNGVELGKSQFMGAIPMNA